MNSIQRLRAGPTWREDALIWDRPRVVYPLVYVRIRRYRATFMHSGSPRSRVSGLGFEVSGFLAYRLKDSEFFGLRGLIRGFFFILFSRVYT